MKILAVYPYVPYPLNRGAYHRAFHLLKGLAMDHEVDLLTLAENGEGAEHKAVFEEFCGRVEVIPFAHPAWEKLFPKRLLNPLPSTVAHWNFPAAAEGIRRMLANGDYGAVHVLDLVLTQFFLDEFRDIPLVLDRTRVDLQYQLMEQRHMNFSLKNRLLNYENRVKLWRYERAIARRSALQVVCGEDDEKFIRDYISAAVPIEVIPNGVDLDYFHSSSSAEAEAAEPAIVFCGAMDYNPNIDALRWFFGEMHAGILERVPSLKTLIVGRNPAPEVKACAARPGVTVTGGVPDVRPYYKKAWLQIVPLRIGGGTRLKIVESLGIGTPVVSTTIGAQGLGLRHDHEILLADSAELFIKETVRALHSAELRDRLRRKGLETARARLSWKTLGARLSAAYSTRFETIEAAPRSGPALAGSASR